MLNMGAFITRHRSRFVLFLLLIFAFVVAISVPKKSNELHRRAIISLASHYPVTDELYWAVQSLLLQTITPKEIRVYMPESRTEHLRTRDTQPVPLSALVNSLVELRSVEDVGRSIGFIPVLRDLMDRYDRGDPDALDQPVIIVGEL